MFVLGCTNLKVITDHKPILSIFNSRDLSTVLNPGISKLKEKTIQFKFTVQYCPEKWHKAADAVSSNAVSHKPLNSVAELYLSPSPQNIEDSNQIKDALDTVCTILLAHISNTTPTSINCDTLITFVALDTECKSDEQYQLLKHTVQNGFPRTQHLTHPKIH